MTMHQVEPHERWPSGDGRPIAFVSRRPADLEAEFDLRFESGDDDLGELQLAAVEVQPGKQIWLVSHRDSPVPGIEVYADSAESPPVVASRLKSAMNIADADLQWVASDETSPGTAGQPPPAGFLSYARSDDDHDGGYLTSFRRALEGELRAQTGEQITVFQDREDVLWGEVWRERINAGIDSATILIPIITPSFFVSAACRKELERFLEREKSLGRSDLIFPLYYIRTPLIQDPARRVGDKLAQIIASREYRDWTDNRFEAIDALPVRRQIAELAGEMVAAFQRGTAIEPPAEVVEDDPWDDETPGFVERVAAVEVAFPRLNTTLESLMDVMGRITATTEESRQEIDRVNEGGQPPGARLNAIQRYKSRLGPVVGEFESLADEYSDLVSQIDAGIGALIDAAVEQADPNDRAIGESLLVTISGMHQSATEGLDGIASFQSAVEDLFRLSSTLRPVLKRLDKALHRILESRGVFAAWSESARLALEKMKQPDD